MNKIIKNIELHAWNYIRYQLYRAIKGSNKMDVKKKFNTRAFISTGLLFSFIGLPFSGYMNHIIGFDSITVQRHLWMSVHNVLGLLFLVFAVCHIIINHKTVISSVKKVSDTILSKEAVYAASIILFFLTLFVLHAVHFGR
jgi:hypothetical protein